MTKTYSEKLKDPRWQKKRLEILERDMWICQKCFDDEKTLHVHHRVYDRKYENPWEYPADLLVTLCEDCHSQEASENWDKLMKEMGRILKRQFFLSDVKRIMEGFNNYPMPHGNDVCACVIEYSLSNKDEAYDIMRKYFEHLAAKSPRTSDGPF